MNARGFGAAEAIVGVSLGLMAVLGALTLTRGLTRLTVNVQDAESRRLAARWALEQIVRAVQQAGVGVCPDRDPACTDEAIESFEPGVLVIRGDLDRDDPGQARVPESLITGPFREVRTGNDELWAFTRRASGGNVASPFSADLDSPERATLSDGTPVAARDGLSEAIDLGGVQPVDDRRDGTLYRIGFSNDARLFGSGRFRISEPLADTLTALRFEAFDRYGAAVGLCGGAEDAGSRACRASIRRVRVSLTLRQRASRSITLSADAVLP